ncbi:type VII secretion integral membrane protein EccD [Lentzea aerocolonigenes]|uniref:type VII secretion integral membrane protein EccD n=1 Tax=Lentzea aerocolonigenes TaxID=68170 RepID=UPI000AE6051F|nr:type VII secretion integral membrane protein EccD [Lentzea aerocolonigenes]
MNTTGLARLTVVAPNRRVDLALPERSPLAELLPAVLRHAGEHLADDGIRDGGWVLRRADGTALETGKSLGAQRVRDGEVLHLTTAGAEWPELEYDDVVDAIATGAGRTGSVWAPKHTRFASLTCGAVAGLLCLVSLLRAGIGPWVLAAAGLLAVAAVLLARAGGDGGAGAVLGAVALPFAFVGGGLLLGTPNLLLACAALLLAGVVGLLGVVDRAAVFAGAAAAGLFGALGAWLATFSALGSVGAAAVVAAAGLAFSPCSFRCRCGWGGCRCRCCRSGQRS